MSSQRQVLYSVLFGLACLLGVVPRGVAAPLPSSFPSAAVAAPPVFASSVNWHGFKRYWTGFVKNSDRVVVIVAIIAAMALFIITRGKWMSN